MRRPAVRTLLLVLTAAALGVSSAFLVACGDRNDLIPRSDASSIESDYRAGHCGAAQQDVEKAQGVLQARCVARRDPPVAAAGDEHGGRRAQ